MPLSRGTDLRDATISHVHEPEVLCLWFFKYNMSSNIDQLVRIAVVGCRVECLAGSSEWRMCVSKSVFFGGITENISVFYELNVFLSVFFH